MTIAEMNRRVQSLDIKSEAIKIIEKTPYDIIEMNTKFQLQAKGIDKNNNKLLSYKNQDYSAFKNALNPAPGKGNPDLKLTGAFYDGFYVKTNPNSFYVGSDDPKAGKLEARYGKDIFGLTKENLKDYSLNIFYPYLKEYITSVTGLKFK